jgi:hypothetical protein
MEQAAMFIYLLCLSSWLGSIIFFSFFTAPALFKQLSTAEAGRAVSAIFPFYYALGYGAGLGAVAFAVYFALSRNRKAWWSTSAIVLGAALALTLYAGMVVRPRIEAVRGPVHGATLEPSRQAEFGRLHRLSVSLNGLILILDLVALAATAVATARNV